MVAPIVIPGALKSKVEKTREFEKNIRFMYLDTTGNVTVGYGHNLTSHGDRLSLKFKVKRFERKPLLSGVYGVPNTVNKTIDR